MEESARGQSAQALLMRRPVSPATKAIEIALNWVGQQRAKYAETGTMDGTRKVESRTITFGLEKLFNNGPTKQKIGSGHQQLKCKDCGPSSSCNDS
eukprot:1138600-Pelagomonas_calceolata.AAC.4